MDAEAIDEKRKRPTADMVLMYTLYRRRCDGRSAFDIRIEEMFQGVCETLLLDDFTDREAVARRIFSLFVEGDVTVCTAEDILFEQLLSL